MYEKKDKRRLYWLIDKYLNDQIDERTFCDEFYYSYSLELNHEELTDIERKMFSELDLVVSRFSEFGSDHELDINAFSTVEELHKKVIDVKEKLSVI